MRKLYFAGCVIAAACLGGCTKTNEIEPVSKGSGGVGKNHAGCHRLVVNPVQFGNLLFCQTSQF